MSWRRKFAPPSPRCRCLSTPVIFNSLIFEHHTKSVIPFIKARKSFRIRSSFNRLSGLGIMSSFSSHNDLLQCVGNNNFFHHYKQKINSENVILYNISFSLLLLSLSRLSSSLTFLCMNIPNISHTKSYSSTSATQQQVGAQKAHNTKKCTKWSMIICEKCKLKERRPI